MAFPPLKPKNATVLCFRSMDIEKQRASANFKTEIAKATAFAILKTKKAMAFQHFKHKNATVLCFRSMDIAKPKASANFKAEIAEATADF